ncbi:HelD family protein [Faecalicatena fissicatena]|uniref:UvrD-helicase domain-containing protein n=1 Tax=Faecalicatena fissicatena TaxID=290055 RepID=A0ABS2E4Q1_9FIRM|nr:UvrD-helicase domain-containing protein [Faecalicatena fissicatena]MBM6736591.1 UvrD-helicase domain-containing protein [Faecalicatena fissicatena]HIX99826.1 UvrD-helicase domain-containing protein [Candidatus Dorea intestinigallinarum]
MNRNEQYTEGISFLEEVTQKLKNRIEKLDQSILAGQKDIESMHDYYWENYTEMDQYGYEDYDNQQALLNQTNANNELLLKRRRFRRMQDSPFFGRVDFVYEGEDEAEIFYIGIGNFAEDTGMTPLIYDWRAPVSGLFYDYDRGPASYQAPAGVMEGEITAKKQYKIRKGKLIYAFESDTKIDDEILKAELGTNGDVKLKNIVSTIQREQNAIIRNTEDKILAIQGVAGSGKTSVALHRIAYLLYHDRDNLKSSDVLILSPNSVFADYISHILPELGEEPVQEMSFDLFAYKELKGTAADCEDRWHHLERVMKFPDEERERIYKEKQSEVMAAQMEGFLAILEDSLLDFKDIEFKGLKKTENELIQLFYFKFQDIPLLKRMDAVMEYFVDEFETLRDRDLSDEEREYVQEKFDRMYVTKDIYRIYNWLMEDCGYPLLADVPCEKRVLEYEDVFPMLYLKYRLLGRGAHRRVKHLVIDEMQDYSYIQYLILAELFSCSMTILGDKFQTMDDHVQDVLSFLPKVFGRKVRKIVMDKSYRNTVEIASYAARLNGSQVPGLLERHGKEVVEASFEDLEKLLAGVEANLRLQGEDGFETAAVLAMTEEEAWEISQLLKKRGLSVSYIDRDSSSFKPGLTVTTFYLAKGLEFDQVFTVWDKKKENPLLGQAKYICATRALHELYMFEEDSSF